MKKVEYIFFDLGGVLYTLDYQVVWNGFCEDCGKSLEQVQSVLYAEDIFIGYETGEISSFQYYKTVKERLSCQMSYDEFKIIWNSILIKQDDMFLLVLDLNKCMNVLFLSNINEVNAEVVKNDLGDLMGNVVFSFQVGCMKPGEKIFRLALEKIGLAPEKTVFIDDLEENVEAARLLGIHSHLYKDKGSLIRFLREYGIAEYLWEK